MPRDGQHYMEAVNMSRTLLGLPWLRTPPVFAGWGTGPWGQFPWGGDPTAIGAPGSAWEFTFDFVYSAGALLLTAYFTNVPSMSLFYNYYARPALQLDTMNPWDTRLRWGASAIYVGGMSQDVTEGTKKAGAWCPGCCVQVAVEVGLPGHAPFKRFAASARVPG